MITTPNAFWSGVLTDLRAGAPALAIATAGAVVFHFLGFPAPALIGAVTAASAAAIAGRLKTFPKRWRDVVFVLLGSAMGSAVTPETMAGVGHWPGSMLALAVAVTAMTASSYLVLRKGFGWDRTTAFYASPPGALSATLVMASTTDADISKVAVVQIIRVVILTMAAPIAIVSTGDHGPVAAVSHATAAGMAAILAAGIAGALIFQRLRFPGGLMVGAFLASAVLHASGVIVGRLPDWLTLPAFVALGAVIGTRFSGLKPSVILSLLKASLVSFFVTAAIGISFALAVGWALAIPAAQVFVAFAPGALEAMMLTAFMLGLDPAYVGAHHVARFVALSFAVPVAARLIGATAAKPAEPPPTDEDV